MTTKKIELQNEISEMKAIFNKFQENGKQQFLNEYIDRYKGIIIPLVEKMRGTFFLAIKILNLMLLMKTLN